MYGRLAGAGRLGMEGIDEGHEEEANPKSEYRNQRQGRGKQKSKCRMQNDNAKSKKGCAMRVGGILSPRWGLGRRGRGGGVYAFRGLTPPARRLPALRAFLLSRCAMGKRESEISGFQI
jgi:hypothetical protein